jgi:hypothetical protein
MSSITCYISISDYKIYMQLGDMGITSDIMYVLYINRQ